MKTRYQIDIQANSINSKCFSFECPLCYKSIHSKKPRVHSYPSQDNLNNRIENVVGFCKDKDVFFSVHINDSTERDLS